MARPKGAINKRSARAEVIMELSGLKEQVLNTWQEEINSGDPVKKLHAAEVLMPYLFPKLQAMSHSGQAGAEPIKIIIDSVEAKL